MSYTCGQNLAILARTVDSYCADNLRVDARTHGHTHIQSQATTIPEGQNWPEVIKMTTKSINYHNIYCFRLVHVIAMVRIINDMVHVTAFENYSTIPTFMNITMTS